MIEIKREMCVETKKSRVKCAVDSCGVERVTNSVVDLLLHLFVKHVDDSNLSGIICAIRIAITHKYTDDNDRSQMKRRQGNAVYIDNRVNY